MCGFPDLQMGLSEKSHVVYSFILHMNITTISQTVKLDFVYYSNKSYSVLFKQATFKLNEEFVLPSPSSTHWLSRATKLKKKNTKIC